MPWIDLDDNTNGFFDFNDLDIKDCDINIFNVLHYPISISDLMYKIDSYSADHSQSCKIYIESIKNMLLKKYHENGTYLGYQSGYNKNHIQKLGQRYYKNDNLFLVHENFNSDYAYKIKISYDLEDSDIYFDESYFSFKMNNYILSLGRKSRWWSPSKNSSLILSNASRPSYGVEIKNYQPIMPKRKIFSFFGNVNYELFVNKLEKNRTIPNALLLGSRVSLNPSKNLNISLLRTAQFGGDNRPTDSKTILNLLIGKDNAGSKGVGVDDQPGNQLAGIDFKYKFKKIRNASIYGQIIGEDEAGYLPSRNFYLIGGEYAFLFLGKPLYLNFDSVDTSSGRDNYTYSHTLYKDGYRYLGLPIGASIDADSKEQTLSLERIISDSKKITFSRSNYKINENSNSLNSYSSFPFSFNEYRAGLNFDYKKYYIDINFIYRDKKFSMFNKNSILINLVYKI